MCKVNIRFGSQAAWLQACLCPFLVSVTLGSRQAPEASVSLLVTWCDGKYLIVLWGVGGLEPAGARSGAWAAVGTLTVACPTSAQPRSPTRCFLSPSCLWFTGYEEKINPEAARGGEAG